MSTLKFHKIWIEQCDAAREIKIRYGIEAAFDYIVAEKLLNFSDAAARHSEFARELPRFVACVRSLLTRKEIRGQLTRIEREQNEHNTFINESDEFNEDDEQYEPDEQSLESVATDAERTRQFALIKELLTAPELGTS